MGSELNIIIGAGGFTYPGWISTEQRNLDLLDIPKWDYLFLQHPITRILAEHVWEHLSEQDGYKAAENCYKHLCSGGVLRIAVPDGYCPNLSYIEAVKPGGTGAGADDHMVLYTLTSLTQQLKMVGFIVNPLEYYDEYGCFHAVSWNPDDGLVTRSLHFDSRNQNGSREYTSLIVDAIKPGV